ncbi:MAG: ParA family protein [Eggerthellaceae bacterium]|nr:ParA family protein [Eggerthellaceae bacterium]
MGKVLAITNRKGGTGKTMTSVSLGASLVRQGKKVLVVDADSQHSATVSLGVAEPDKLEVTLATVMQNIIREQEINPLEGIISHNEGISFLPSNNGLAGMEIVLAPIIGRETVLRRYIDKVRSLFDYILLDTAPTLDLLAVNSLAAADSVIIPVAPKFLDAKGLELLLKSIAQTRQYINPHLEIGGILLTMVDRRANITKEIIEMIRHAYGESISIFKEAIPHSVRAVETSATGKSIFEHDPNGKVAMAYASLAREVLASA